MRKSEKKLALSHETIRALSSPDLVRVAGGVNPPSLQRCSIACPSETGCPLPTLLCG